MAGTKKEERQAKTVKATATATTMGENPSPSYVLITFSFVNFEFS